MKETLLVLFIFLVFFIAFNIGYTPPGPISSANIQVETVSPADGLEKIADDPSSNKEKLRTALLNAIQIIRQTEANK
jgi:hypothetical protein